MKDQELKKLTFCDYLAIVIYSLGMFGFGVVLTVEKFLGLSERMLTVPYRLIILLCSILLIGGLLLREGKLCFKTYMVPLVIFWTAYVTRFVYDAYVRDMPMAVTTYSDLLFYVFGMCFVPMLALLLYGSVRGMALAVGTSLTVVSGTCIAILLFSRDLLYSNFGRLRAEGGLNEITLGHLGVSLVTLCLFLLCCRIPLLRISKAVYLTLIVFGLTVVGLASSRGPLLSLLILFLLMMIFAFRQGRGMQSLAVAAIVALLIPSGFVALKSMGSNIDERIAVTFAQAESRSEARFDLWQSAWEDFLDHPLTGRALEGRYDMYPHNLLLESFMATGIVGGAAFVWLLVAGLCAALRLILSTTDRAWLGFLFIQMLIYGTFSGALWSHFSFWYMLAAVFAYGYGPGVVPSLQRERHSRLPLVAGVSFFGHES